MAIDLDIDVDRDGRRLLEEIRRDLDRIGDEGKRAGDRNERSFKEMKRAAQGFQTTLHGIHAGLAALGGGALIYGFYRFGQALVQPNRELEVMGTQFRVLLGSAEAAHQRIEELVDFAAKTPFELPGVIEASKILEGFGLGTIEWLRLVGDAAAFAGRPLEEVAGQFGRISSGAFGEAIEQFRRNAIAPDREWIAEGLGFDASGRLDATVDEALGALQRIVERRFGGMMEAQSRTLDGMLSNWSDFLWTAGAELGEGVFENFKGTMAELLALGERLQEDGTIEAWGQSIGRMFDEYLVPTFESVINFFLIDFPAALEVFGAMLEEIPTYVGQLDIQGVGQDVGAALISGISGAVSSTVSSAVTEASGSSLAHRALALTGFGTPMLAWMGLSAGDGSGGAGLGDAGSTVVAGAEMADGFWDRWSARYQAAVAERESFRFSIDRQPSEAAFEGASLWGGNAFSAPGSLTVNTPGLGPQYAAALQAMEDARKDSVLVFSDAEEASLDFFNRVEVGWGNAIETFLDGGVEIGEMFEDLWGGFRSAAFSVIADVVAEMATVGLLNALSFVPGVGGFAQLSLAVRGRADGGPAEYAGGGEIWGPPGSRADQTLIAASRHEYMINARSAQSIGRETLDHMNATGQAPSGATIEAHFHIGRELAGIEDAIQREIVPALERLVVQNQTRISGA